MATDGRETTEVVNQIPVSILDEVISRIQVLFDELQEIDKRCNVELPVSTASTWPESVFIL